MSDTTIAAAQGAWTPFEATLSFDWARPPLSMNDRQHPAAHRKLVASTRAAAALAAARLPELGRCRVILTWFVTDKRKRDAINVCATLKPLADGLVDAGIVPDDTPNYMDTIMPRIVWLDKKAGHVPHFELHIERLPTEAVAVVLPRTPDGIVGDIFHDPIANLIAAQGATA